MKSRLFAWIVLLIAFLPSAYAESSPSFSLRTFSNCADARTTLGALLSSYADNYWTSYPPIMYARDAIVPMAMMEKSSSAAWSATPSTPTSTTNVQVAGVDESDIVKTDGKNIYTYRATANKIEIVSKEKLTHLSTITLPKDISGVNMYLEWTRLVILASKYSSTESYWNTRWYNPETKTLVQVYSLSNPSKPILTHFHTIDGYLHDSRLIGDRLYFLTQSDFRIAPYYMTKYQNSKNRNTELVKSFDANFLLKNIVPEVRDSLPNPVWPGKYITSTRSTVSQCQDLSVVLPNTKTLSTISMTPVFTTIASLNIAKSNSSIETSLVFGAVNQIHMSQTGLYLVSNITKNAINACPSNAKCFAPTYYSSSSSLIHRFALQNGKAIYKNTAEVVWNPMNQYSMDEDKSGSFRIVTQSYDWVSGENKNTTNLSIIGPSWKIIGSLSWIAPGENFQSARFIWNRLYLVTFQQIDPLFVIDLVDSKNPKILGELKMPGYSTYLHPYDNNRLIGIGYDTITNKWWWTQNAGIKIDLYNVVDIKNPKREASLTLGDAGSSSEVLNNPRAFVWYKEKNLLLLPATIMTSAKDPNDTYRSSSAFQWLIGVSITPGSIIEKFRVSHINLSVDIEKAWKKDCDQYLNQAKSTCQKLLDGSEYCPASNSYVPPYCYAGSTVETYFVSQIWNYSSDFVARALYTGENFYSVAEGGIRSWNFANPTKPVSVVTFTGTLNQDYRVRPAMVQ